jgi:Pectate lyase superfamily protein
MRVITLTGLVGLSLLVGCVGNGGDATDDVVDERNGAVTVPSTLWGTSGERWTTTSRLPDYSYVGYHNGEAALPNPAVTVSVRNFGALGDGKHDDTQAFLDAIAKTASGVIRVPAGTYIITKRIAITKSHIVLRGDGPTQTILEFPKSLAEVDGKNPATLGSPTPYSYGDTFLTISGNDPTSGSAKVTAGAKRGSKALTLSSTSGFSVGQWVSLFETDVSNTLAKRLYGDTADPGTDLTNKVIVSFQSPISAISGNTITLKRPIPVDVETRWSPQIGRFAPSVTESGIEQLGMHFKGNPYLGHAHEAGYNAIALNRVFHSWVRNVRIVNADIGVLQDHGAFCTITGVTIDTDYNRGAGAAAGGAVGHHALWLRNARDSLVTAFDVRQTFVHDLTAEGGTTSVFSSGKGLNVNLDHHRDAPYGILFTDIDLGKGTRAFDSGGAGDDGAHAAAYTTFWGLRSSTSFGLPSADFGPLLNFVGVNTSASSTPNGTWSLEKIAPTSLAPANLQAAMQRKRTGN